VRVREIYDLGKLRTALAGRNKKKRKGEEVARPCYDKKKMGIALSPRTQTLLSEGKKGEEKGGGELA